MPAQGGRARTCCVVEARSRSGMSPLPRDGRRSAPPWPGSAELAAALPSRSQCMQHLLPLCAPAPGGAPTHSPRPLSPAGLVLLVEELLAAQHVAHAQPAPNQLGLQDADTAPSAAQTAVKATGSSQPSAARQACRRTQLFPRRFASSDCPERCHPGLRWS